MQECNPTFAVAYTIGRQTFKSAAFILSVSPFGANSGVWGKAPRSLRFFMMQIYPQNKSLTDHKPYPSFQGLSTINFCCLFGGCFRQSSSTLPYVPSGTLRQCFLDWRKNASKILPEIYCRQTLAGIVHFLVISITDRQTTLRMESSVGNIAFVLVNLRSCL